MFSAYPLIKRKHGVSSSFWVRWPTIHWVHFILNSRVELLFDLFHDFVLNWFSKPWGIWLYCLLLTNNYCHIRLEMLAIHLFHPIFVFVHCKCLWLWKLYFVQHTVLQWLWSSVAMCRYCVLQFTIYKCSNLFPEEIIQIKYIIQFVFAFVPSQIYSTFIKYTPIWI